MTNDTFCGGGPAIGRSASATRATAETEVSVSISLDSAGGGDAPAAASINSGCGFLNHMLTLFSFHSGFALSVSARGDTDVDFHHLTEDIGITLGACIKKALGDCRGIARYASLTLPMDEALVLIALDISGRAYLNYDVQISAQKAGDFDTELAEEFLAGLCRAMGLTLHVKMLYGKNAHHILEAIFKGLGRALRIAAAAGGGAIPSSKGGI